jgi:hypothetical protein
MTTPQRMLESLKDELDLRSTNFLTDRSLMHRLHTSQQEANRVIAQEDPSFFVAETDVSFVADQRNYSLPLNARLGTRWIAAENRISGDPLYYVYDIALNRSLHAANVNWPWNAEATPHISWFGDSLRVSPTPTQAVSGAIRLAYIPAHGNMVQGAATSTTSTTFSLFSGDPDFSDEFGYVDSRDDFYNGMKAFVVSGTGAGQERPISDYDGSSRKVTVSSAWTVPLSAAASTSVLAIMCPTPEDFRDVVVLHAAWGASPKTQNRQSEYKDVLFGSPGRSGRWNEMIAWVGERNNFRAQTVESWGSPY